MSKLFFPLLLIAVTTSLQGQTARDYDTALDSFMTRYNSGDYSRIYSSFAQDMKEVLSFDAAKGFFGNLNDSFGALQSYEYEGAKPPFQRYRGDFADGELNIDISLNLDKQINGISLTPREPSKTAEELTCSVPLTLPVDGAWHVYWGGTTPEDNYHVNTRAQRGALDLVIMDEDGNAHQAKGERNKDYYAFGKKVMAPVSAKVVFAVDGIPDNMPGAMNAMYAPGNSVLLEVGEDAYLLLAHLKQGSVAVSAGDEVQQGDLLGLCGNSGNSSEAHVHMHVQDGVDLTKSEGLMMLFEELLVDDTVLKDHAPIKGQTVANP